MIKQTAIKKITIAAKGPLKDMPGHLEVNVEYDLLTEEGLLVASGNTGVLPEQIRTLVSELHIQIAKAVDSLILGTTQESTALVKLVKLRKDET